MLRSNKKIKKVVDEDKGVPNDHKGTGPFLDQEKQKAQADADNGHLHDIFIRSGNRVPGSEYGIDENRMADPGHDQHVKTFLEAGGGFAETGKIVIHGRFCFSVWV
jgi:hypothetical protein